MARNKHDWPALKREFFESDIDEVKAFFSRRKVGYSGYVSRKTKGRTKEKSELKQSAVQNAKVELNNELKDIYKPSIIELRGMQEKLMALIVKAMKHLQTQDDPNTSDIEKLWRIIKTELGEATDIIGSETSQQDKNLIETFLQKFGDGGKHN